MIGAGFPAVNGDAALTLLEPLVPLNLSVEQATGLGQPSVFASEFGCVSMPSFESIAPTLDPDHWSLHGGEDADNCTNVKGNTNTCEGNNPMSQRNYPVDNLVLSYFGGDQSSLDDVGEVAFKQQLYQSLLAQALHLKSDVERRRSGNSFGTLLWQLNEIWPTGGWGTVEYGSAVAGQVVGGRWKPVHHLLQRSVFADVMAACGTPWGRCYCKNDAAALPFNGSVRVSAVRLPSGEVDQLQTTPVQLGPGPGQITWFNLSSWLDLDPTTQVLVIEVVSAAESTASLAYNVQLLAPPKGLLLEPAVNLTASVADEVNADGTVDVTLTTDGAALFTTLTTLAQGRFSDNALLVTPPSATVKFLPWGELDLALLQNSTRAQHLGAC